MNFLHNSIVLSSVFMILIIMSISSWYVIFRKTITIYAEYNILKEFRKMFLQNNNILKSMDIAQEGYVSDVVRCAQRFSAIDKPDLISMNLSQTLDLIKIRLDSGLTLLASVSNSAPFVGLFGTVWGIYLALADISSRGSAGLSVVAGPMGEALTATAVGLFAAIPAALAYNVLLRYNRLILQDLRHVCEQFCTNIPSTRSQTY